MWWMHIIFHHFILEIKSLMLTMWKSFFMYTCCDIVHDNCFLMCGSMIVNLIWKNSAVPPKEMGILSFKIFDICSPITLKTKETLRTHQTFSVLTKFLAPDVTPIQQSDSCYGFCKYIFCIWQNLSQCAPARIDLMVNPRLLCVQHNI